MKEITQYLSEDTSVYATALAAAKADYQHAVSVVAHEFYTQRNGVSIDAQELRALSNVIETAVAHPARFARRLRKLQRYARAIAALEPPFQSTRPRGARPDAHVSNNAINSVSIHAPARGAT